MRKVAVVVSAALLFGVLGWVAPAGRAAEPDSQVPEEARRHLQEALGAPFVVFRGKVLEELKLSDEQKEKVDRELLEFKRQQCAIPSGILGEFIVGNNIGADLSGCQMVDTHGRDVIHADELGCLFHREGQG